MPYFPTDSIIVVWGYRVPRPNMTESHKLGVATRSTKPVACHHLTIHVHSNRGLREIGPGVWFNVSTFFLDKVWEDRKLAEN